MAKIRHQKNHQFWALKEIQGISKFHERMGKEQKFLVL
jgi:hypothetical protein